jgi:uncharacterized membrane protein YdbT with pleckstrin-like domain
MKQLDPKAIWLFFISMLFSVLTPIIVISASILIVSVESIQSSGNNVQPLIGLLKWLWLLIPIAMVLCFVYAKLTYYYYRYDMSEPAFRKEHGIIWKRYVSIPYDRIQNVDIHRGVVARLLGLSDLQIQTAGGITAGSYGAFSEGRLVGLSKDEAEKLRDELIQRARSSRNGQGL